MKICHLTSAHPAFDIRIFHKECLTLARAGYEVVLIAQHDHDESVGNVRIRSLPRPKNRMDRVVSGIVRTYHRALSEDALVYHFHDPELIPVASLLRRKGKMVVYDVHEDVPRAILTREWVPIHMRKALSKVFEIFENRQAAKMSRIITATPFIRNRFAALGCHAVDVNNYPILSELYVPSGSDREKEKEICYVGSIDRFRGIHEIIEAVGMTDVELVLAGTFSSTLERENAAGLTGWKQVRELGQIDRTGVANVLAKSMAGLVLYHPCPNHTNAQPNKIFEYMSAGIPVIASDFPLWRKIIQDHDCGICCDPMNPGAIAEAVRWIADHPADARRMGANGRKAVESKYNWENESTKLLLIYEQLLKSGRSPSMRGARDE